MAKKRKKAKKKKAKVTRNRKANTISNATIISTKGIEFADLNRESKYDSLIAKISKLKGGQSILLDVPKGVKVQVYHNRLNSAFRKNMPKAPKGCTFEKRTTKSGKVAISCVKN